MTESESSEIGQKIQKAERTPARRDRIPIVDQMIEVSKSLEPGERQELMRHASHILVAMSNDLVVIEMI